MHIKPTVRCATTTGSGGGEEVRATASFSRGPEFGSTLHQAFFSSSSINYTVSFFGPLKGGASLLFFLFPIIPLAVLPEAKQA